MAGMNLSSSKIEQKEGRSGIFDGSFSIILTIFFLVVASWVGMRWYIMTLNDKLASIDSVIAENSLRLQGKDVDRVATFDSRLSLIGKQLQGESADSQKLLTQLEGLTVPNVRLTEYRYDVMEKTVVVSGETENFKYVAQQIISLKSEKPFTNVTVDSLKRTKEGRIAFSFKAKLD
ncbi:MAG: hypothetical protein WAW00_02810 [Candidatus Moraniibacteriota bacterium]